MIFPQTPEQNFHKLPNEISTNSRINVINICISIKVIIYEHPGYVRADDEKMRLKIEAHRETEPIIGDWYNDVWLGWTPETKNFHPTNPDFWEGTVPVNEKDLPKVMVDAYKKMMGN